MASIHITELPGIEFVAGRNFRYQGVEFQSGDPFDFEAHLKNDIEVLVRAGYLRAVVDNASDIPRTFYGLVKPRDLVFRKLNRVDNGGVTAETATTEGKTINEVKDVVRAVRNNDDRLEIIQALYDDEVTGANRSTLLTFLLSEGAVAEPIEG